MNLEKLASCGIDTKSLLDRFMGNEALIDKFFKKFFLDSNYKNLKASLAINDFEKAYECSHTLKGMTGNMSMTLLHNLFCELTQSIKSKNSKEVSMIMDKIDYEYQRLYTLIEE